MARVTANRRLKMRTVRIVEHISLDGVIQAPGGPDEDGDYADGGWIVMDKHLRFSVALVR